MMSIFAAAFGLFAVLLLWQRQRPAFVAGFLIVFGLAYRMIDVAYLDLAGPLYAIELERHIGGNSAAPIFVVACLCFLIPLGFIASRKRILAGIEDPVPRSTYLDGLQRAALAGCSAVMAFLYLDMLRIGAIPLFTGMDRLDYLLIAGVLHNPAYEMNFLFSATLAMFTIMPRLRGGGYSFSFAGLALALLLYWALTGNRFSPFLVTTSYYALPFGAVIAMREKGILRPLVGQDAWSALLSAKVLLPLGALIGAAAVVGLLFNSYFEVRGYADPLYHITQRVLVQPVQLWSATWQQVSFNLNRGIDHGALDYVLLNSPYADTNSSIRFLMEQELGYFRATELFNAGQQYAGGYPEILFEVFGFWLAIPLMLLLGSCTAFLIYLALRLLCLGRILTAFMAIYVSYGFTIAYVGGMLNFLLAPTFAMKLVALVIIYNVERFILGRNDRAPEPPAAAPSMPGWTGARS